MRAACAVRRRHVVALDRELDVLDPVEEVVDGLVAVAARDDHGRRAELDEPLGQLAPRRPGMPASASASGRFGVTTVASGNNRRTSTSTASSWSSFAPELATMTGSTTSGHAGPSRKSATVSMIGAEEHAGLGGVDADVVVDSVELRADELGRQLVDAP